MKTALLLAWLSLFATSAQAAPRLVYPAIVLISGQALDAGSTVWFTQHTTCLESSRWLGPSPTPARIMALKAASTTLVLGTMYVLSKSRSRVLKATAHVLGYSGGLMGAWDGVRNLRVCSR